MAVGMLVWLLLVAAVVAGLVLLLQALFGGRAEPKNRASSVALTVLNERFARGEIDQDEFEERRSVLRSR